MRFEIRQVRNSRFKGSGLRRTRGRFHWLLGTLLCFVSGLPNPMTAHLRDGERAPRQRRRPIQGCQVNIIMIKAVGDAMRALSGILFVCLVVAVQPGQGFSRCLPLAARLARDEPRQSDSVTYHACPLPGTTAARAGPAGAAPHLRPIRSLSALTLALQGCRTQRFRDPGRLPVSQAA
jgi:hypothetical protein